MGARESLLPAPNYNTPVKDLTYKDLTITFTLAGHERGIKTWCVPATYPECLFRQNVSVWKVQCRMSYGSQHGVMCSVSVCDHYWSIEGWIHSQRRNTLDQKLVEKLVRVHTNLVLRESLDDTLRDLLPWVTDLICWESRLVYPPIICMEHLFWVFLHNLLQVSCRIPQPFQIHITRFIKKVDFINQPELFLLSISKKKLKKLKKNARALHV